jgi:outer membrane biosynthesis protein TonB
VSKSAYPYPPDEFDQVDLSSRPKEVHAARRSLWGRIWPFLLVIVLVPVVAFLAVHFLAGRGGGDGTATGGATASQSATAQTTPPAETSTPPADQSTETVPPVETPTPDVPDTPTETATETEPVEPTDTETSETPAPVADMTALVLVRNNGAPNGSAADAAETLQAAGWANASFDTVTPDTTPTTSTVYYSRADQEATAQQVASTIGVSGVELNETVATTAPGGILVIVTAGYQQH